MQILLIITLAFSVITAGASIIMYFGQRKTDELMRGVANAVVKLRGVIKSHADGTALSHNAEIIYSDMLRNITPIVAAADAAPRDTDEHPLWKNLGGLLDAYAVDPYVLEKLRRELKINANTARSADLFLARANGLLAHLSEIDPNGILAETFTDGLLGQSITLISSAQELAKSN